MRAGVSGLILVALQIGTAQARETISLAGRWKFRLDEQKVGISGKWYTTPLNGNATIQLPGTMDDAGLGPRHTNPPTLAGP